jgi:hypothetical protein
MDASLERNPKSGDFGYTGRKTLLGKFLGFFSNTLALLLFDYYKTKVQGVVYGETKSK